MRVVIIILALFIVSVLANPAIDKNDNTVNNIIFKSPYSFFLFKNHSNMDKVNICMVSKIKKFFVQ